MTIRKLRAIYVATALVSFKALVLFVLLNLGIYAVCASPGGTKEGSPGCQPGVVMS